MTTEIYKEALAERNEIVKAAEGVVASKLIATLRPQIKKTIEKQFLLESYDESKEDEDEDLLLDINEEDEETIDDLALPPVDPAVNSDIDVAAGEEAGVTLPDEEGKITIDLDSMCGDNEVDMAGEEDLEDEVYLVANEAKDMLNYLFPKKDLNETKKRCNELKRAVNKIIEAKNKGFDTTKNRRIIKKIQEELDSALPILKENNCEELSTVKKLKNTIEKHYNAASQLSSIVKSVKEINRAAKKLNSISVNESYSNKHFAVDCYRSMKNLTTLRSQLMLVKESVGNCSVEGGKIRQVEQAITKLYKEFRQMTKKNGRVMNESSVMLKLGLPDGLELDPSEVEVSVSAAEEEDELGDMSDDDEELDLDVEDEVEGDELEEAEYDLELEFPEDVDVEPGDVDISVADLEMDDDDVDLDLDDDEDVDLDLDDDEDMMESLDLDDDDVIVIDRRELVEEMKKMKAKANCGHGPGKLDDFGGGKDEGDALGETEYVDEDLIDAEMVDDEELDEADSCDDDELEEMKESLNLTLRENKALKAQLKETKLLNKQILSLNKLLQVPGVKLTNEQKVKIVEKLEEGRSEKHVQELYKKIYKAIASKRNGTMNESTNKTMLNSSSRATKQGSSTINESALTDRWAKIAGIN